MIVDAFLFFNELDLLEIRLNTLAPYVDHFVLCECGHTFSGNEKPLFYNEHKDRYRQFNIKHIISPDGVNKNTGRAKGGYWGREYFQREHLVKCAMAGMKDSDILFVSDLDEIPDMESYNGGEGSFYMCSYCYYFNCFTGRRKWVGTRACKKSNIKDTNGTRDRKLGNPKVGRGWHFSFIGSLEDAKYKMLSYSHYVEFNKDNIDTIDTKRNNLIDPYNDIWKDRNRSKPFVVSMPDGPRYLLDNNKSNLLYQK